MPIYEYQCSDCSQVSEFFLKVSDPTPESCPRCNKSGTLTKKISQTSFALKGDGWYVTDYKAGGGAPKAAGDAEGVKQTEAQGTEGSSKGPEGSEGGAGSKDGPKPPQSAPASESAPLAKPSGGAPSQPSSSSSQPAAPSPKP